MALLDAILDRTGAIGARIRGYSLRAERDRVYMSRPSHVPKRTKVITSSGVTLVFDAVTDIQEDYPTKVTSFPVEDKSTISDHVINQNPTYSVTGVFSDYSADMNTEKGSMSQQEFRQALMKIRDDRKVVSLTSPTDTFTDLIVTHIGLPRKVGDGTSLFVDIAFEKIRKVSAEVTTVYIDSVKTNSSTGKAKTSGDTNVKTTENKNSGDVPAKEAVIEESSNKGSGLYKMLGQK
jgi:hypothetical protein